MAPRALTLTTACTYGPVKAARGRSSPRQWRTPKAASDTSLNPARERVEFQPRQPAMDWSYRRPTTGNVVGRLPYARGTLVDAYQEWHGRIINTGNLYDGRATVCRDRNEHSRNPKGVQGSAYVAFALPSRPQ